jgi:hypothetical protein
MRHPVRTVAVVTATALALLTAGAVFGLREAPAPASNTVPARVVDRLAESIARDQQRLRTLPGDYETWAALGLAYVVRARVTADPSLYPKAEGALRRSLEVHKNDNSAALVGLGALANARHEFAAARTFATDALRADRYAADAYGPSAATNWATSRGPLATCTPRPPSTPPASPPTPRTSRCCAGAPASPPPPAGSTPRSPTPPRSRPGPRRPIP